MSETIGANAGLGHLMVQAGSNFQMPLVFACLLGLAIEGIAMYAVFAYVEYLFHALGLPLVHERGRLNASLLTPEFNPARLPPGLDNPGAARQTSGGQRLRPS